MSQRERMIEGITGGSIELLDIPHVLKVLDDLKGIALEINNFEYCDRKELDSCLIGLNQSAGALKRAFLVEHKKQNKEQPTEKKVKDPNVYGMHRGKIIDDDTGEE